MIEEFVLSLFFKHNWGYILSIKEIKVWRSDSKYRGTLNGAKRDCCAELQRQISPG